MKSIFMRRIATGVSMLLLVFSNSVLAQNVPLSAPSEVYKGNQNTNNLAGQAHLPSLKNAVISSRIYPVIELGPLTEAERQVLLSDNNGTGNKRGKRLTIGIGRLVPAPYSNAIDLTRLNWTTLADGGQAAQLNESPFSLPQVIKKTGIVHSLFDLIESTSI